MGRHFPSGVGPCESPPLRSRHTRSVLHAWGMSEAHADTTAEMMVETDLRGVDSHGISMLPTYDREFQAGRLNMRPVFKSVRESPATALIDADASLGHPVSVHGMNLAVDKCLVSGVAACACSTRITSGPPAATRGSPPSAGSSAW